MDPEEVALRAKIQAMKNLLQATGNRAQAPPPSYARVHGAAPSAPWQRRYPVSGARSANKVWVNTSATATSSATASTIAASPHANMQQRSVDKAPVYSSHGHRHPVNKHNKSGGRSGRSLHLLRLEDGEYAKANGGFSLVRSDVMKAQADAKLKSAQEAHAQRVAAAALRAKKAAALCACRASRRVTVNGVTYAVVRGGTTLRRISVASGSTPSASIGATTPSAPSTTASTTTAARARAVVTRARVTRARGKAIRTRTEYCRFFNKFGYCKNKTACTFIHDSRRVALCPRFLKGACPDEATCLLSHDKSKMPVCSMFLRGSCTRESCRFRHVKGDACTLRHERPAFKRKRSSAPSAKSTIAVKPLTVDNVNNTDLKRSRLLSSSPSGTSLSLSSEQAGAATALSAPALPSAPAASAKGSPLSIRPNIRFQPRRRPGFPSLVELRKNAATASQ